MDGPRRRPLESGRSRRTQPRSAAPRRRSMPADGRRELAAQHNTPLAPFMQRSARQRHAIAVHCAKSTPNRRHCGGRPTTADARDAARVTLVCGRARNASPEARRSDTRVRTSACALIARVLTCLPIALSTSICRFPALSVSLPAALPASISFAVYRTRPHSQSIMPTFGRSHLPTPRAHIPT